MPSKQCVFSGIAIGYEKRGEKFVAYQTLRPSEGPVTVLKRQSAKPHSALHIDLYDEGEFCVDLKPNAHTGFLKEFTLHKRRTRIASNYAAFELSARFTQLILRNPIHEENAEATFRLTRKALDAWSDSPQPEATYFKSIYLYCRDEGYPVIAEWYANLEASEALLVKVILNTRLEELDIAQSALSQCIARLETYITQSTHIQTFW